MALTDKRKKYLRELYRRNLQVNREKGAKKSREWRKNNIDKARLKESEDRTRFAERRKKYAKEYAKTYKKDKVKVAARTILNNAVATGKVARPLNCEQCKQERPVQGHHEDYSKPLDVIWLCIPCHGKEHRHLP